ncbi:MAG: tRNA (cytidine(34)-2'-O)-methyltransferase, partial [Rickettsiales bacterium]
PQNTGSLMRLTACLGVRLHIIEPCGFLLDDKQLKRVAMDYGVQTDLLRHVSWSKFLSYNNEQGNRLILLSTKAKNIYTDFTFKRNDILLLGRESSGVPNHVADAVHAQIKVPMHKEARSLNVALAASMVLGEALRQTGEFCGEITND